MVRYVNIKQSNSFIYFWWVNNICSSFHKHVIEPNLNFFFIIVILFFFIIISFPSQLVDINEGFLSLMMDNGDVREDLRVPEGDLGKEIESKHSAGEDMMVSKTQNSAFKLMLKRVNF